MKTKEYKYIMNDKINIKKTNDRNFWLFCYLNNKDIRFNLERKINVDPLNINYEITKKYLISLENEQISSNKIKKILSTTLSYIKVSKTSESFLKQRFKDNQINFYAHNEGSAKIFHLVNKKSKINEIIYILIKTSGLLGQHIRGETPFFYNKELYKIIENKLLSKEELNETLTLLNKIIISEVSDVLYKGIKDEIKILIKKIINNDFEYDFDLKSRIQRLRQKSISNGERKDLIDLVEKNIFDYINNTIIDKQLWYVETALQEFEFSLFIKVFLLISTRLQNNVNHISFENLMYNIYYEKDGSRKINIFKQRIIEKFLKSLSYDDILKAKITNEHVSFKIEIVENVALIGFEFSSAASSLITFCIEAEKSIHYMKAIVLLYEMFGFLRDDYDRLSNSDKYFNSMNYNIENKLAILEYVKEPFILDIGSGGGELLDKIEQRFPNSKILGLDLAENAIEFLKKKKNLENKKWDVIKGDARNIKIIEKDLINYFSASPTTIIFSSILHHVYSFSPVEGKFFSTQSVKESITRAFNVLTKGGKIIIRDGIMSENKNEKAIIEFKDENGFKFLNNYCSDFKGRKISYEKIDDNKVKMYTNDAMEFLYTYTWGEKSYPYEVKEQFGYFTPNEYKEAINEIIKDEGEILLFKHYLQEGYTTSLQPKINFYDEKYNKKQLPDSTCFIIISKNH